MTTQHTPGPWTVDYSGPAHLAINDLDGRALAFCALQCENGDEDAANARLIAASPDLLAFAERVASWKDFPDDCNALIVAELARQASELIRQAKGEA